MKTRVYIDGFNLYFGAVKGTNYKWLNVVEMARRHLQPQNEIIATKYFTAELNPRPHDPDQPNRQRIYLRALRTLPNLEIFFGHFLSRDKSMRLAKPSDTGPKTVKVIKTEEKGSDVNLASQLLKDAFNNAMDCAVLITGDSDFKMPVQIVKDELGVPVGVLNPQKTPCAELRQYATFYKHLRSGKLRQSQFPDILTDAQGTFHKPNIW